MSLYNEANKVQRELTRLIEEKISSNETVKATVKAKKAIVTTAANTVIQNKVGVKLFGDDTELFLPYSSVFSAENLSVNTRVSVWYNYSINNGIVMNTASWTGGGGGGTLSTIVFLGNLSGATLPVAGETTATAAIEDFSRLPILGDSFNVFFYLTKDTALDIPETGDEPTAPAETDEINALSAYFCACRVTSLDGTTVTFTYLSIDRVNIFGIVPMDEPLPDPTESDPYLVYDNNNKSAYVKKFYPQDENTIYPPNESTLYYAVILGKSGSSFSGQYKIIWAPEEMITFTGGGNTVVPGVYKYASVSSISYYSTDSYSSLDLAETAIKTDTTSYTAATSLRYYYSTSSATTTLSDPVVKTNINATISYVSKLEKGENTSSIFAEYSDTNAYDPFDGYVSGSVTNHYSKLLDSEDIPLPTESDAGKYLGVDEEGQYTFLESGEAFDPTGTYPEMTVGTAGKVENALTIINGDTTTTYNGSSAQQITIPQPPSTPSIPTPTEQDSGKVLGVDSQGEYALVEQSGGGGSADITFATKAEISSLFDSSQVPTVITEPNIAGGTTYYIYNFPNISTTENSAGGTTYDISL